MIGDLLVHNEINRAKPVRHISHIYVILMSHRSDLAGRAESLYFAIKR